MSLKQPIGQKRLTNVAVVKYKKKGKRFEIACYKNKVINWRTGVEKEIDDVLQTMSVFANVSKGVLAKHEDLVDVFGTDDEEKICRIILKDGDYQVTDKEREMDYDSCFKDVATILASKSVNPKDNRPYTISMLEKALKDIHFSVDPKRTAKQQALEILPELSKSIPIERAKMRLRIQLPASSNHDTLNSFLSTLASLQAKIEQQDRTANQDIVVCQVGPEHYRQIHSAVQESTGNKGSVEVVNLAVTDQGVSQAEFDAYTAPAQSVSTVRESPREANDAREQHDRNGAPEPTNAKIGLTNRQTQNSSNSKLTVLYAKGKISDLPDEFVSRRERFQDLDDLQEGWTVELSQKGGSSAVDATFFAPNGEKVGAFANARRMALQAKQKSGT